MDPSFQGLRLGLQASGQWGQRRPTPCDKQQFTRHLHVCQTRVQDARGLERTGTPEAPRSCVRKEAGDSPPFMLQEACWGPGRGVPAGSLPWMG